MIRERALSSSRSRGFARDPEHGHVSSDRTFVIVGAGFAGAKAAETLRDEGFDGRIVLIGAEAERPYERPPLSKDYLRGEAESKPYVHDEGFYAEREIELRGSTRVASIDPAVAEIVLEGGERMGYARLLLATGAEPRRVSVPGANLDGVLYLRTIADSEAIRDRVEAGGRLVTIGAGWIGAEVAASARQKGCEVTVIERASLPLERVLGPELGAIYRDIHSDHGVKVLTDTGLQAFEGEDELEGVRTDEGERIEADFAVVGVGVAPRTELAEAAGIDVDNGILVDSRLQTSAPGVFAAGDVANAEHPLFGRIRVEHWANALNQGPAAARNMLGAERPYDAVPYFFSDQYDVGMEYAGYATEWDEVVFRGDPKEQEFIAFWIGDGRVLAGMNVNVWDVTNDIQELVRSKARIDLDRLADPDAPLGDLA
jgi:3-phenylpropionate/trans-cinnamate dioxygenase ferredoxin reductase subunit